MQMKRRIQSIPIVDNLRKQLLDLSEITHRRKLKKRKNAAKYRW